MPLILRLGDPGSHGGNVCTGCARTFAEGIAIARVHCDIYCCPIHGPNPIASGCVRTYAEDCLIAFDGSVSECGATLSATAQRTWVE